MSASPPGSGGSLTTRIGLLASLYFSQGLPFGFFTQALPVLLRQQGASLPDIGLANLLALPWALKFLWAPWVDRRVAGATGGRRRFILPLQAATALLLVALAFLPSTQIPALLAAVLLINLLAATQDVATDGLAVKLLTATERGAGSAVQVGAYRIGMIVGGGALLMVIADLGQPGTFTVMAGLVALASLPILRFRGVEPAGPAPQTLQFSWFSVPGAWRWLLLLVVYKLGDAVGSAMIRPLLVDRGLGLGEVGWLLGTIGSTFGLLGALLGGALFSRLSRRSALVSAGVAQSLTLAGWAAVAAGLPDGWIGVVSALEHLGSGVATVTLFATMMDAARREHAGTDYTIQASAVVIATAAGGLVSGFVAEPLGYVPFFCFSALVSLAGALTAIWLRPPVLTPVNRAPG